MAWLRIELTEEEQRIVLDERESHPDACVRRRLRDVSDSTCWEPGTP